MQLERYVYDAYGRPILWLPGPDSVYGTPDDAYVAGTPSLMNNPRAFTGRDGDFEALIHFYRRRSLHPSLGRFLTRHGTRGSYTYIDSDPTTGPDPSGLEKAPPGTFPDITPPEGECYISLCCRPVQVTAEFCHCFVLLTDSAGKQIYYDGQLGSKTWKCKFGVLEGRTGTYGTGDETFDPKTKCSHYFHYRCDFFKKCLQSRLDAINDEQCCYCYGGRPNSNSVAWYL